MKSKNFSAGKTASLGLFHKILAAILLVLILSVLGAVGSAVFSNRLLGHAIDKKFGEAFDEVFLNVATIFEDFEKLARENIRKTSGLLSLEKVWGSFMEGHEKYLNTAQKTVLKMGEEYADSLGQLALEGNHAFDRIAEAAQKKQNMENVLQAVKKDFSISQELIHQRLEASKKKTTQFLEESKKQIDEEVKLESGKQVKNAIGKMGKANVVLVGSQEAVRREIEDIKYRAVDSMNKSVRESNGIGIMTLIVSMGIVAIFVIIISLLMTRSITKPITVMVEVLQKMAKGQLPTAALDIKTSDEIGQLFSAFNEMATNLKNVTASRDELNKEIGDRRRAEEALQGIHDLQVAILNSTEEGILVVGSSGKIMLSNQRFSDMWGLGNGTVTFGDDNKLFESIISKLQDPKAFRAKVKQLYQSNAVDLDFIRFKDGRIFERFSSPLIRDKKVEGRVWNFRDITDRKLSEEKLKSAQSQLIQSEKMSAIGQLAAGVAHEINNPLGVILGFSQSVAKRLEPGNEFEHPLKSIEREAMRCKHLVQDLLIFSRAGKIDKEPTDLKETIEGALSLVLAQTRVKNVELVKEFIELPQIIASRNQIQQVLINLSNNAMDAMPEGGTLTIVTKKSQLEGKAYAEIQVQDTGGGIPEEIRSKIFEPFFTTKEVGKGTGLGLSLVYEIVQKHEGKITVQSEIGKGTTFQIFLPAI